MLRHMPVRSRVSIAFLLLFSALMAGAILAYPGGSFLSQTSTSFGLENFWCDLFRQPAHNGAPNRASALLATSAFAAMAVALLTFWLEIARVLPPGRGKLVRVFGPISAVCTAFVALIPSDRFPRLHAPFVLTAGALGFLAGCVCCAWAIRRLSSERAFGVASAWLILLALANMVLYGAVVYGSAADSVALPVIQKLATAALLIWMVLGLRLSASRPTR